MVAEERIERFLCARGIGSWLRDSVSRKYEKLHLEVSPTWLSKDDIKDDTNRHDNLGGEKLRILDKELWATKEC